MLNYYRGKLLHQGKKVRRSSVMQRMRFQSQHRFNSFENWHSKYSYMDSQFHVLDIKHNDLFYFKPKELQLHFPLSFFFFFMFTEVGASLHFGYKNRSLAVEKLTEHTLPPKPTKSHHCLTISGTDTHTLLNCVMRLQFGRVESFLSKRLKTVADRCVSINMA